MKPYAFGEIIVEEGGQILSPSRMKNLIGVLSKTEHVRGTHNLLPHEASAAAYFSLACPSGNFPGAEKWWNECREAWEKGGNEVKDLPVFAIMALLADPEAINRLNIQHLIFTDDFRLIIYRGTHNDHLPKGLYIGGKVKSVLDMPPPKRVTWVPAHVFLRIAERLELEAEDVPTYEKAYCQ